MLTRMRRQARMYRVLVAASMRAQGQYRANLIIELIGAIAYQGAGFAFIWVVVDRFGNIGGWSLAELALLYGLRLGAHGFFTFGFAQLMGRITEVVREGEFDRYLTRPVNPLIQLLTRRFNLTVLGDLVGGIALIIAGATHADVAWTAASLGYLVLALLGAALVEAAMHLTASALAFRMTTTYALSSAIDQLLSTLGGYPLKIFPVAVQFGLTFVFPLAFIAYFPATVLLGRTDELVIPWLAAVAPLVGMILFAAAYGYWRSQIRHYSSTGH